jgi:3-oxoacyl-[acyl-carrier-protein] synthase II
VAAVRACVTGMGVVSPIGCDLTSFWNSLLGGRSGARPVRSFDTAALPNHVGCEIDDLVVPEELRVVSLGGRCTELALLAVRQAVDDAGAQSRLTGASDAAVVVGTTMGEVTQFEADRLKHSEREPDVDDVRSLVRRPLDVMARSIARLYGVSGPVVTVPAACAAGSYAIGVAASLILRGEVQRAIAVGCEAFSRLAFVGFSRMHAMSPDACRPFSRGRPGLLLGEGAGALVLESEPAAGRPAWGHVDGFGLSCDAFHVTAPHPQGQGAIAALRDGLRRARLDPDAVDYVNAHGTGTALNDKMESQAVHAVFGERSRTLPVSSIKALTGHTMGAAGALEAVASFLAIRHGVIPPTWNWEEPDPDCELDCVPNEPRERALRHVVSNSYAFGGNNASLVLSAP